MQSQSRWTRAAAVAAALLVLGAGAAFAQLQTGNLYGKVSDQTGAILPGVTVTLDTGEAPQVQVTNAQGEFRFLSLAPATYKIKAELQGFSPVEYPHIVINVGRNTTIEVTMNSAVEDVITVTSESPLLDERAIRTGNTVSQNELARIPTARDPWTVLQSTPGVLIDRVNVGGNESGQQSTYTGPGSFQNQSIWSVDGVVITDMAAIGSTPSYFDFGAFEEMQISTGGSDATIATGGVVLNLVTKRGTNEYRGSARYLQAPGSTESSTGFSASSLPTDPETGKPQHEFGSQFSNKINKVDDWGGEIGGPILKDHIWAWGSYGQQDVSVQTLPSAATPNGLTDKTKLPTWNAKANAQITASNSLTLFGSNNSKQKTGRNAGPTRTLPTAWDQGQFGGKPTILKAEDTQIFSPNLYATLLYSHVYGGFFLNPIGGTSTTTPDAFLDSNAIWQNSFLFEQIKRPQTQEKADASTFFNTGSLSHELKYGAAYRIAESATNVNWSGSGLMLSGSLSPELNSPPSGLNALYLSRAALPDVKVKYTNAYAQDTLTAGNLTLNLGLRFDRQTGDNLGVNVPANPIAPTLLPAVAYAGAPSGFTWTDWSPRVGLTYALGKDRSTLLRASYSRFADQLSATFASFLNPLGTPSYYYAWTTNQGDGHVTPGQVVTGTNNGYSGNVNPANGLLIQPNAVSSNFSAPITNEFLVSAEHALLPEFVVGFNLTYRTQTGLEQEDLLVQDGSTFDLNAPSRVSVRSDYQEHHTTNAATGLPCPDGSGLCPSVVLPNGQRVPVVYYELRPGVSTGKGLFLHNGDYETTFKGASLTFNKRLSNRWMMRGNISYNDWYFSKAGDRPDPTIQEAGGATDGNYVRQGDVVLQGSGNGSGSKAWVYINSKWSFAVNGLYQIAPDRPWGFNVAANVTGRQGYPVPFYDQVTINTTTTSNTQVQLGASDSNRLDNIVDVDGRLEKEFTFQDFGLTLGVDCFNLFNEAFTLQRVARVRGFTTAAGNGFVNAGFINETLSPRIFRFGARLSFK
ncbi:MAG TPA: TonB-dependent receptor [Thermoanaerobaculia bacterium]|nr:TonB-dependent receptor [Thermoanaerobaculia bacterium]